MKKKLLVGFFSLLTIMLCIPQISPATTIDRVLLMADHHDFGSGNIVLNRFYDVILGDITNPASIAVTVTGDPVDSGNLPLTYFPGSWTAGTGQYEYYNSKQVALDYNWSVYNGKTVTFSAGGVSQSLLINAEDMKTLEFDEPDFTNMHHGIGTITWDSIDDATHYRARIFSRNAQGGRDELIWDFGLTTETEYEVASRISLAEGDYIFSMEAMLLPQNNTGSFLPPTSRSTYYHYFHEDGSPVPEPTTVLLFGTGLLFLTRIGRKR